MKLPMKRKMIGSANGAKTARAGATCRMIASTGPMSAVTASGSASVIQRITIIREDRRQPVRRQRDRIGAASITQKSQRSGNQTDVAAPAIEELFGR